MAKSRNNFIPTSPGNEEYERLLAEQKKGRAPEDRYIISTDYASKHALEVRDLAPACRKGAIIGIQRLVADPKRKNKIDNRWFILDIPPQEHPGWSKHQKNIVRARRKSVGKMYIENLKEHAPRLLEKFNAARVLVSHTRFKLKELADMLGVGHKVLIMWTDIGVDGFGRLPKIVITDDKRPMRKEDGSYYNLNNEEVRANRIDYYYETIDVIRFLSRDYALPGIVKRKTVDDVVAHTNADEIAAEHGYYIYDAKKVYPMTSDGFISWLTENVRIYDPETDRPIKIIPNDKQRELYKKVFEKDEKGNLKHKLICISRPRGEYKTADVCFLVLFFFLNRPKQRIFLIACNSQEQAEHLLMGEIKEIIRNSPSIKDQPWLEMLDGEINILSGKKEVYSFIKTASIKAGTLSNASIFVFTEFFDLADRRAFAKLEGSTRARANAFSVAEGIATDENHIWHEFYKAHLDGKDPKMYFQWYGDEWHNPRNTADERAHFLVTHGEAEFTKHFRNVWGGATMQTFLPEWIYEIGVYGIDNTVGPSPQLSEAIAELHQITAKLIKLEGAIDVSDLKRRKFEIISRLRFIDDLYRLPADEESIGRLQDIFGFEYYSIGVGLDRAKQMSKRSDRTALVTSMRAQIDEYRWLCFVLDVFMPDNPSLEAITSRIEENSERYGFISQIDIEEYQGRDIHDWLIGKSYQSALVPASFKHKDAIFPILYTQLKSGLFKCPTVPLFFDEKSRLYHSYPPDGVDDILRAELAAFIAIERIVEGGVAKKVGYYGSKYKMNTASRPKLGEPNDDVVEGLAHSMHALNNEDMLSSLMRNADFAYTTPDAEAMGEYGDS